MVGIYYIKNIINNKMYIGQSTNTKQRIATHRSMLRNNYSDSWLLQEDWNIYKEENFEFGVLQECEKEQLDELERYYIAFYSSVENGYNLESGGRKGFKANEESIQKMRKANTGKLSPFKGLPGKPWTEERKEKMSIRFSGEKNPMYGVHLYWDDERKKEFSESRKGDKNHFYGKKHTPETIAKIKATRKMTSVRCIETNIIYESANEAKRQTGIHNASILRAAKNHLTAGGFHWEVV